MTEQANPLMEPEQAAAVYAENLLQHYSFELGGCTVQDLLTRWCDRYPSSWVRLAIVEALYQGRYKAVSVEQILILWQRRGQPCPHFNHEFERLVCNKFPRNLAPAIECTSATLLPRGVAPLAPRSKRDSVRFSDEVRSLSSQRRSASRFSRDRLATDNSVSAVSSEPGSSDGASRLSDSAKVTNLLERLNALKQAEAANPSAVSRSLESDAAPACSLRDQTVAERPLLKRLQAITERLPLAPDSAESSGGAASSAVASATPQVYQPYWQGDRDAHQPIHKFTPATETADFPAKLRAVAQPELGSIAAESTESLS